MLMYVRYCSEKLLSSLKINKNPKTNQPAAKTILNQNMQKQKQNRRRKYAAEQTYTSIAVVFHELLA